MTKEELEQFPKETRSAIKLLSELNNSQDYNAISKNIYKTDMFLYDLNSMIENKKYKSILSLIKMQYGNSFDFDSVKGIISEDEKRLRNILTQNGFHQDDFFNPLYDKNSLVAYTDRSGENKVYKVESVFKDSGAYLYNLRDLQSGVQVGGRLRQDEISLPSIEQQLEYYKSVGNLDVHLFNKFCPIDEVSLEYKKELLEALKGNRLNSDNKELVEISKASINGLIDDYTYFNLHVMLSDSYAFDNKPITIKLKNELYSKSDMLDLEVFALKNIEIIEKYNQLKDKLQEIKKYIVNINDNDSNKQKLQKLLWNNTFASKFDNLNMNYLDKLWGNFLSLSKEHPDLFKLINNAYNKSLDFIQERDIHKLNRPELNELIKDNSLTRDLLVKDKIIFRSLHRNVNYEYDTIKDSSENRLKTKIVELNIANNGYRREFYQYPTKTSGGCNISYCEGDVNLVVTKNKDDFENRLNYGIEFYIEDESITYTNFKDIKKEMIEKLKQSRIETLQEQIKEKNPNLKILSQNEFNSKISIKTNLEDKYIDFLESKLSSTEVHPTKTSEIQAENLISFNN